MNTTVRRAALAATAFVAATTTVLASGVAANADEVRVDTSDGTTVLSVDAATATLWGAFGWITCSGMTTLVNGMRQDAGASAIAVDQCESMVLACRFYLDDPVHVTVYPDGRYECHP